MLRKNSPFLEESPRPDNAMHESSTVFVTIGSPNEKILHFLDCLPMR